MEEDLDKISLPKEPFDKFYTRFTKVEDIVKHEEWSRVFHKYYEFDKLELEIVDEPLEVVEAYSPHKQSQEIIKCVNSFPYFCHKYIKLTHPHRGLIPFILYKYQKRVIEQFETNRFSILSKFRQGGLTTVAVMWSLWLCLFSTEKKILVCSKTDREAMAAGDVLRRAMDNLPKWLLPQLGKNNEHEVQFLDTNSVVWFYTPEAARGKSLSVIIIDEAAFIADMHKHWKSMYSTISTGGSVVVISTVNGMGNWYEEWYHKAQAGKNEFKVIDLDYWEHPDYNNPNWVRQTRANMGEKTWRQEVLRDFLGSGDTFFPADIVGELEASTKIAEPVRIKFDKWNNKNSDKETDELWSQTGALWIWKEPIDGHEYIIGTDCAEGVGEGGDNSCFQVLDTRTMEQVAEFYSNSVLPNVFAQILNEIGIYYNTALIVVENMSQGVAVLSDLVNDFAYENIYYQYHGQKQQAGLKTNKNNRPVWLETLQNKLVNKMIKINSHRLVVELNTFVFNPNTKRAEAQRGKHDDAIMALAMALYVRDQITRDVPVGAVSMEEAQKVFKTAMYEEIRREILNDKPEDWLADEEEDSIFAPSDNDVLPGVMFDIRRKKDSLIREFGW